MSFESKVLETALDKMLNKESRFSICDLQKIGELIGVEVRKHPRYKFLNALHCVSYSDMDQEIREQIPHVVMEVLRPDYVNVKAMSNLLLKEGTHQPPLEDNQYLEGSKVKYIGWNK